LKVANPGQKIKDQVYFLGLAKIGQGWTVLAKGAYDWPEMASQV
jgi:hypothetical protein